MTWICVPIYTHCTYWAVWELFLDKNAFPYILFPVKLRGPSCQWAHNMLTTSNGEMTLMDTCRCRDAHIACESAGLLQEHRTTRKTYREWHPLANLSLHMMVMHTGGSVASTPAATKDTHRAGLFCFVSFSALRSLSEIVLLCKSETEICMLVKWCLPPPSGTLLF